MPKPPKAPAVVFITKPPAKVTAPLPDSDFDSDPPFDGFAPTLDQDEKPLLFQPPLVRPISTPSEFDSEEKSNLFQCAVHEAGHAIGSLIVCQRVHSLTVASINGSVRGSAFSSSAHGEDAAIVDLAGIAAEQLVAGAGDCHSGAQTDIKLAREHLRDDNVPEGMIDRILQDIHRELQRAFTRDWLPGIKAAASELARAGILDKEGFIELVAMGQREAVQAGSLQKSLTEIRAAVGTLHKSTDPFETLAKSLENYGRANDQANLQRRVHQLDRAISQPGITAHEVSRREAMRNHADLRAQQGRAK